MQSQGLQVSTPTDTTIAMVRTFRAPRRLVWQAMFTPEYMRRWMSPPPGWTLAACECHAHTAGALRLQWQGETPDQVMTMYGVFTDVVPHERIVHTESMVVASGATVASLVETHAFAESGGVTTLRITQVYESKEARDGAIASGMDSGMEACYQQLDAVLATPA